MIRILSQLLDLILKCYMKKTIAYIRGAQWLSGRVLDSRPKGREFKPHLRHCVVSLSKTH